MFKKTFQLISLFFLTCNAFSKTVSDTIPIAGYWQQRADYFMEIDVDVKTNQYTGKQTIIYKNNSPDQLKSIYFHLYFNAFQPGSDMDLRLQNIEDPDSRMVIDSGENKKPRFQSKIAQLKPDEIGYIKINSLKINGENITFHTEGTVLEVDLNSPILPNSEIKLELDFKAQIPKMIRRSGRNNNEEVALSMAQWFPKIAEYDTEGWHTDPYIMREFYGVWGDYDVKICIDKNYTIAGTGYLLNPEEIGHGYSLESMRLKKDKKLTWHFSAPNVHDFTWAADTNYIHDVLELSDGTLMRFFYKNETENIKIWKEMQPFATKTMEFYNQLIGKYYYKQYSIIQGGDGGMEYGMCTLVNSGNSMKGLLSTVVHEMAHAWFQFALASNESKHPWMDEGFASFVETLALEHLFDIKNPTPFKDNFSGYFYMIDSGREEPLTTHSDHYRTNTSYGINAYYKGSVFLSQLAYIIGWENLKKTLEEYYKIWQGKHPKPNDFIRIAEKVSGIHLSWYLNGFTETTHTIDYAVKNVENNKVTIQRIGEMPFPIELKITFEDNSSQNYYIPIDLMRNDKKTNAIKLKDWSWANPIYILEVEKKIKKVKIDYGKYMMDTKSENDFWN